MLSAKYRVLLADDARSALGIVGKRHADLILLDLNMPGMSGLDFLDELNASGEEIPVVVVTGTNCVSTAVDAMKRGAREYVTKPFNVDEVLIIVERILAGERDKLELTALREEGRAQFDSIIGDSTALLDALEAARLAMGVDTTVLITGDSGTGKDLLARAIHCGGKRAANAFVPISCCAIPAQLVESELFGHEKGAFTGATEKRMGKIQAADNGTLFLDEIGEMPIEAQAKLLRVLQDGCIYPVGSSKAIEVDVRLICATNRDLPDAISIGAFREDLFYRVNVLPIEMPPLRKRREDIPALTAHFVAKYAPRIGAMKAEFSPKAMAMLCAYAWPGNVRELENTVQRLLVRNSSTRRITPDCLRGILPGSGDADEAGSLEPALAELEGLPLEEAVNRVEQHLITRALARCGHVQSRAAVLLGTTRRILKYKMDQLGIEADEAAKAEVV